MNPSAPRELQTAPGAELDIPLPANIVLQLDGAIALPLAQAGKLWLGLGRTSAFGVASEKFQEVNGLRLHTFMQGGQRMVTIWEAIRFARECERRGIVKSLAQVAAAESPTTEEA